MIKLREHRSRVLALGDQAVVSGTTFLSAAIVARSTSPAEYGSYTLILSALFVAVNLQGAAVTTPFNYRRHSLSPHDQRAFAGSVISSQLIFGATAALLFCLAASVLRRRGGDQQNLAFASLLFAVGATSGAYLLRECCRQLSFAHEQVGSALWLDAATTILQFSGLAILKWRHAFTASHALLVLGVATAVPAVAWLIVHRSQFHFVVARLRSDAVLSWKTGRWLVAGVVAHFAAKDLYPWLLEATRNVQTVALFAAAAGVAMLINPAVTGFSNTLGAAYAREFAERGEVGVRHRVKRDTKIAVYCMIAYVGALAMVGGWLCTTIYGAQYGSSGPLVGLVALSLAASVVTTPIGLGLFALDRTRTTFGAVCVAIVVSVVAGIPLAAKFGATGVGIALCLSNAAESIVKVWLYRQPADAVTAQLPAAEELCA